MDNSFQVDMNNLQEEIIKNNTGTIVLVNNFNLTEIVIRFNILAYVLFILSLYGVYLFFRLFLGRVLDYERHSKTPAKHYHHLVDTFIYGTVLFIFGNYSQCFSWITTVSMFAGLLLFAWIAELPFCKCSLQSIKTWDIKLKIITLVAIIVIVGCAVYHFYLAYEFKIDENGNRLIIPFLIAFIAICVFIFVSTIIVYKYQNMSFPNLKKRVLKVGARNKHFVMSRFELERHNESVRELENQAKLQQQQQQDVTEKELPNPEPQKKIIDVSEVLFIDMPRVGFHLHHWQIFYYLAFFTRFDNPISQICSGLVIGIFMHGVAAYGFHDLLEE